MADIQREKLPKPIYLAWNDDSSDDQGTFKVSVMSMVWQCFISNKKILYEDEQLVMARAVPELACISIGKRTKQVQK